MPSTRGIRALCLLAMLAFALGGCGGEDDSTAVSAPGDRAGAVEPAAKDEPEETEKPRFRASIWRADSEDVKRGIFEFDGFTLYRFEGDRGSKPSCYGACAKQWPPLLTELKPRGVDVVKDELGTTRRKGGAIQVTYFGHPLYTFTGDKTTGEANGNGVEAFGGKWHALRANGEDAP